MRRVTVVKIASTLICYIVLQSGGIGIAAKQGVLFSFFQVSNQLLLPGWCCSGGGL
jgi:hypothetical protein